MSVICQLRMTDGCLDWRPVKDSDSSRWIQDFCFVTMTARPTLSINKSVSLLRNFSILHMTSLRKLEIGSDSGLENTRGKMMTWWQALIVTMRKWYGTPLPCPWHAMPTLDLGIVEGSTRRSTAGAARKSWPGSLLTLSRTSHKYPCLLCSLGPSQRASAGWQP